MKKCVIVSDSFKGTLSSQEICEIARELIPKFFPDCETVTVRWRTEERELWTAS